MKYTATVDKLEDKGDELEVTFTNMRRKGSASWREYCACVSLRMPYVMGDSYKIGRNVEITVEVK